MRSVERMGKKTNSHELQAFIRDNQSRIIRTMFFIVAIILLNQFFKLDPKDLWSYSWLARVLPFLGGWAMLNAFSYKIKESELLIHFLLRRIFPRAFKSALLILALSFTLIIVVIGFIIYKDIITIEFFNNKNYIYFLIYTIFISFTFSLWELRYILIKEKKS